MVNEANRTRIDVGRVIFKSDCWLAQTLESHVGGVVKLTKKWNSTRAFSNAPAILADTQPLLIESARIHDMGKPARFRLSYEDAKYGKAATWQYSFAGHRFDAFHEHPYTHWLAQLHHEYSVDGITKAMARLRLTGDETIADMAPALPFDLYALEMCDQIEATLARSALDSNEPEERVFMDFQFRRHKELTFELEPFPFDCDMIVLDVAYVRLTPPEDHERVVRERDKDKRKPLLRNLERWLLAELQSAPLQHLEVKVIPWNL